MIYFVSGLIAGIFIGDIATIFTMALIIGGKGDRR